MYQAYPKLKIIEDQGTGTSEFQESFKKYVKTIARNIICLMNMILITQTVRILC